MNKLTREVKQAEGHVSQTRRKKEHRNYSEDFRSIESDHVQIYGKFTRPVGSYRRGYKKPTE